jgi:hypothetical protein
VELRNPLPLEIQYKYMDITHTYHFDQDSYEQWAGSETGGVGCPVNEDLRDDAGRLLDPSKLEAENHANPEDLDLFISCWINQRMASKSDWAFASRFVFPEILDCVVVLQRLDIFECSLPRTQQATINREESLRIRYSAYYKLLIVSTKNNNVHMLDAQRDGFLFGHSLYWKILRFSPSKSILNLVDLRDDIRYMLAFIL